MLFDPLGTGLASPVRMGPHGDWETAAGLDVLRADVGDLLGIVSATATTAGEVPWDGDRGSQITLLRHRNVHPELTRALAEQIALGALQRDEPRVIPVRVDVEVGDDGSLRVHVGYRPRYGEQIDQTASLGGT